MKRSKVFVDKYTQWVYYKYNETGNQTTPQEGGRKEVVMVYKDFAIVKVGSKWQIWLNGIMLRECKTKKECIHRIDTQTV